MAQRQRCARSPKKLLSAAGQFYFLGHGSPPLEVLELELIELFHCTPEELDRQDLERVLLLLQIKSTKEQARNAR